MPLFHVGGIGYALFGIRAGAPTIMTREPDAAALIGAVRAGRGQAAGGRLGGDDAAGHDQLGQPAPQLPALAGAGRRQRRRPAPAAQPGLGGVDLDGGNRDAGNGRNRVAAHVTVTRTAGE
ncbi:hypothetical protein PICSAR214_02844 [Mycobacterium avium subsp. paratuberculosis]|nr:hypothetical protein PICSAR214_02844 [Mycobacterium avium subsp. paratuberculosis]